MREKGQSKKEPGQRHREGHVRNWEVVAAAPQCKRVEGRLVGPGRCRQSRRVRIRKIQATESRTLGRE